MHLSCLHKVYNWREKSSFSPPRRFIVTIMSLQYYLLSARCFPNAEHFNEGNQPMAKEEELSHGREHRQRVGLKGKGGFTSPVFSLLLLSLILLHRTWVSLLTSEPSRGKSSTLYTVSSKGSEATCLNSASSAFFTPANTKCRQQVNGDLLGNATDRSSSYHCTLSRDRTQLQ